jgi:nucleotide-binding universal stress UspA family protein
MSSYYCIHGHFYQPPRENPWTGEVEADPSADPYHDWNHRILAECYRPNTAARILAHDGEGERRVNNYASMSFNFGPTLLSWLEQHAPDVLADIVAADRLGAERCGGHGPAMAQVYNHVIMPLADAHDQRTQVRWGIRDFEHRFGRRPEGMWLPETAVDLASLAELAAQGIRFTVLAPHQAAGAVDTRHVYRVALPGGRSIDVFFYDGPTARAVAFEGLLGDGATFAERLLAPADGSGPQLHHIATDGESYGHHHHFGEMALAYAVHHIAAKHLATPTNYAQYRVLQPATRAATIRENTAWSCAHGIERWRSDCGCHAGNPGWNQAWRGPLRAALDWLRDRARERFLLAGAGLFADPWAARDAYIDVVLDPGAQDRFLAAHAPGARDAGQRARALELCEMQRHAMLMYTSCGWFFDDIAGIEGAQVLAFAARCLELAERHGAPLEAEMLARLAQAHSNRPEYRDGAGVWRQRVLPRRVAAHRTKPQDGGMELRKILVGVDFSPESDAAVKQALNIARHAGAEIVLLHVGVIPEDPSGVPDSMANTAAAYNKVVKDQLAEDRNQLDLLRERIDGQGCQVSHMVVDGFADTALVDAAQEIGADLIAVGTHGRTGIKRFLLGSVAERVVRLAHCSVLVARPTTEAQGGYTRILVPTDFSPTAERALAAALTTAAPGATIDLLHCWQLPPLAGVYYAPVKAVDDVYDGVRKSITESVEAASKELLDKHKGAGVTLNFHAVEESAAHGIQQWLETHSYELVVTGSHGRRGVRRFLLGSVAESTVRHAPCSVLVVHGGGGNS